MNTLGFVVVPFEPKRGGEEERKLYYVFLYVEVLFPCYTDLGDIWGGVKNIVLAVVSLILVHILRTSMEGISTFGQKCLLMQLLCTRYSQHSFVIYEADGF
nr:hypothetical protein [Tanacetum cinerariifolium]